MHFNLKISPSEKFLAFLKKSSFTKVKDTTWTSFSFLGSILYSRFLGSSILGTYLGQVDVLS